MSLKSRIPHVTVFGVEKQTNCQLSDFFISIKKNSLGFMGQINVVPEQLASLNEGPEPLVCYLQPPTHTLEAAAQ